MTVITPPRPPRSMPPTAAPPSDPRNPQGEPEALIEEARRRARRRRRLYGACLVLAATGGAGAFFGFGRGGDHGTATQLAGGKPLVQIHAGSAASTMGNGPLVIMALDADSRGQGPPGWYGLSKIESGGRPSVSPSYGLVRRGREHRLVSGRQMARAVGDIFRPREPV